MIFEILTLFPEMYEGFLKTSIIAKAIKNGIIRINIHNLRDFAKDRHRTVDDKSFGPGPGMVLKAEPIYKALKKIIPERISANKLLPKKTSGIIYLSPQGRVFNQKTAKELSKYRQLIFICGHYEGVDERIFRFIDEEISIGDYVLTGGELPSMVVVDAVSRLVKGVVKKEESVECDSFYNGLLDYPHYTRPRIWRGGKVPEVLLSGNHKKIDEWRKKKALDVTEKKRPDILESKKKEIRRIS